MNTELLASRRVARLDRKIKSCTHRVERACLRAERAGDLARQGHCAQASREINLLQTEFGPWPHPEVSVAVYLAQAWVSYFSTLSVAESRERLQRAHALSKATGLQAQQALSAAWLAHLDYMALNVQDMASHLTEALHLAPPRAHMARSRAYLVMGDAYHLANHGEHAQRWYTLSRQHALAEEDDATLSALIYNMAWHRAWRAAQASSRNEPADALAKRALAAINATEQFDRFWGMNSLSPSLQVARALALSALENPEHALMSHESHAPAADAQGLLRMRALVLADMAWCYCRLARLPLALHYAQAAVQALAFSDRADDTALAHDRLTQVFKVLNNHRAANRHAIQAQTHRHAHSKIRRDLLKVLKNVERLVPPETQLFSP